MRYEYISILLFIIIISAILNDMTDMTTFRSSLDKKQYIVIDLPNKHMAADKLAMIRLKLNRFINRLGGLNIKTKLVESKPSKNVTSYTVNKKAIHLCIREHDDMLSDDNTLFFVALHELAHVISKTNGHTTEFKRKFRFLLKRAIQHGYYKYHPYHEKPQKYCGTYIFDTPLKKK